MQVMDEMEVEEKVQELREVNSLTPGAMSVAMFMLKAGQKLPLRPMIPSDDVLKLRCELLLEEVLEFCWAAGFVVSEASPDKEATTRLGETWGFETIKARNLSPNYEEMIDACADVWYVNTGNVLALGSGDSDLINAVSVANLRKFEGDYSVRNGKLIKPKDWKKPEYKAVQQFHSPE